MQLFALILAIKSISGRHDVVFYIAFNLVISNVIDFLSVGVFFLYFLLLIFRGNIFVVILLFETLRFICMFFVKKKNLRPNNSFRKSRS